MSYKKGELISPQQAQDLCILEAKKGLGWVSPNPPVGCVIVDKDHHFLASGYHKKFGVDHAEIDALKKLNDEEIKGAILYVTLEPCAHEGKTPSCAKRLAEMPISKVICGLKDPNPLVSGKGFDILKNANIEIEVSDEFAQASEQLTEAFLYNQREKSTFVALKLSMSIDGKVALKSGESKWITSEPARRYARHLRGHYDATMIGAGTLLADDPKLDFRETSFAEKENKIVIWDPQGVSANSLKTSNLVKIHGWERLLVITPVELSLKKVKNFQATELNEDCFRWLYEQGVYSLFVEGGAYTISSLLKSGHYHKLYTFLAPKVLGDGLSWTESFSLNNLDEAPKFRFDETTRIGEDLLVISRPL